MTSLKWFLTSALFYLRSSSNACTIADPSWLSIMNSNSPADLSLYPWCTFLVSSHTTENPITTTTSYSFHSLGASWFTSFLVFLTVWEFLLNWFRFHLLVHLRCLFSYFWWIWCYAEHFSLWTTSTWLNILCFLFVIFSPFDFTQNCPYLLPPLMEFVFFALCFILCHSGKVVTLIIHPPIDCPQLRLRVQSQQKEAQEKAAGNEHHGVLNKEDICTEQCFCFAVMPRTLSCYILYTPTTKHSTCPWPDTPCALSPLKHSCILHWTMSLDEDQTWSKM